MNSPIAALDACVLYSASLRDLFMWLAASGLYMPKWTEQIHEEWIRNVLKNRPDLSRDRIERTRSLMNLHAEGSLVEGFQHWIPTLKLPDENDRHVLAAAIEARAPVIVTFNLSDYPKSALAKYEVVAQHPDEFLCGLFDREPNQFLDSVREMIAQLKNPPRNLEQHIEVFRGLNLPRIASLLTTRLEQL